METSMTIIIDRLSSMHSDIGDLRESVKDSMKDIAVALNKLALVEERQSNMMQAHERLIKQFEKSDEQKTALEIRIDALEKDAPMQKQVTKWFLTAVWTAAAAAVAYVAKFVGLY